jgi:chitinase
MKRLLALAVVAVWMSACSGNAGAGALCGVDAPDAGGDRAVFRNAQVILHAYAPGSERGMGYDWSLLGPDGGSATFDLYSVGLQSNNEIAFWARTPGTYVASVSARASCGSTDPTQVHVQVTNRAPTAKIAYDQFNPLKNNPIYLYGRGSTDPDIDLLSYAWTITSAPPGSTATLESATSADTSLTPDVEGDYTVQLIVDDGIVSSAPATVTVSATDQAPVADAGPDQAGVVGSPISLIGGGTDPDGDALSYAWSLVSTPAGAADAGTFATLANANFVPDAEGTYVFSLAVRDRTYSSSDQTQVTVYRRIAPVSHGLVDARFDPALGKIVFASDAPNAIELYDPTTETEQAIPLQLAPTSLALSPDGKTAAVGHNGYLSVVDLVGLDAGSPVSLAVNVSSVAVNSSAVYAMGTGATFNDVYTYHLATGTIGSNYSSQFYDGAKIALQPNGTALYGASNLYLMRLALDRSQNAAYSYESAYANRQTEGAFWFSADGGTMISDTALLFHVDPAATSNTGDLTYAGGISTFQYYSGRNIQWADEHPTAGLALIPERFSSNQNGYDDTTVQLFTGSFFNYQSTLQLPQFVDGGVASPAFGKFVFHSADGGQLYVVVQGADTYSFGGPFGVVTY